MQYLVPSTAPTVSSKNVRKPRSSASRGTSALDARIFRPLSPEAQTAFRVHGSVVNAVGKMRQRTAPQHDDGGIIGSITGAITHPAHVIGDIGLNALGEIGKIIPGSSRIAYETVKNVGQAATGAIPGVPWSSRSAIKNLGSMGQAMVTGLGADVGYVAGPILRGNWKQFAQRVRKEPVRTLGTLGLLYSGAGAAVRGGAEGAAAAARVSGATRTAEKLGEFASKRTVVRPGRPVPRRYRAPEKIGPPSVDAYGRQVLPQGATVTRTLRPRSANPITREIQRAVTDKAFAKIKAAVGKAPIYKGGKNINPMSPTARYTRLVSKESRNKGAILTATLENDFLKGSKDFQSIVRSVPKKVGTKRLTRAAHYTAAIRAMGLNNLAKTHTSRTWGRDQLIDLYEKAKKDNPNPVHVADIEHNLEVLKSIPDHWLDPARAPKVVNELTHQTVKVLDASTELKLKTGLLSPETAAISGRRSQMTVAGVLPDYRAYISAQKEQRALAEQASVVGGKIAGITAQITRIETKARASGRPMSQGTRDAIESARQEVKTLTKQHQSLLSKQAGKAAEEKALHTKIGAVVDWEMSPGSYFPARERILPGLPTRRRLTGRPTGEQTPRMTMAREHENKGIILRRGTAAFGPDVTLAAFRNALDLYGRQRAVEELVTKYVVRGPDGNPITDAAAVELAKHSNNLYIVRSTRELVRTLASNDRSAAAGELLNAVERVDDTKYLIPRAVDTGWRQALGARKNVLDNLNSYWKAGVLALSPRWYMQNFIGMWSQFLLGAGTDLQAIKMAASPKYRDAVLAEIEGHGLASDLGEFARREGGREGRNRLRRVVDFGYKWNSKFESLPRRAMYFNALKKRMREEEFVGKSANSAELADSWLNVTRGARKNEQWANELVDQVITETERFMGDYLKYNQFERTILRRAFPFYGWLRAIHRLAFALPFKYPKRTALLMAGSRMAYEMYNDNESILVDPIAGIIIGKNKFLGTGVTNPFETLRNTVKGGAEIAQDVATGDFSKIPAAAIQEIYPQLNPLLTAPATVALGRSPLNIPLKYGYGTDVYTDPRTGRSLTLDPLTGQVVDAQNQLGLEQMIGRNFPVYNLAKRMLAGGTPTESASLGSLLAWRLAGRPRSQAANLVVPGNPTGQALTKGTMYDLTNSLLGLPVYGYSPRNALLDSLRKDEMYMNAFKSDMNKQIQAQALYGRIGAKP